MGQSTARVYRSRNRGSQRDCEFKTVANRLVLPTLSEQARVSGSNAERHQKSSESHSQRRLRGLSQERGCGGDSHKVQLHRCGAFGTGRAAGWSPSKRYCFTIILGSRVSGSNASGAGHGGNGFSRPGGRPERICGSAPVWGIPSCSACANRRDS